MNRIVHSPAGYVRMMQMSGSQIFAFVEGGLDRPFAERLLKASIKHGQRFTVVASKELPGNTGGKNRLTDWFRELRQKSMLNSDKFGKKLISIFFLDKDSDDFNNKKLRSNHVLYTDTYDLEGHLYQCGDVTQAIADAALITTQQAIRIIPSPVSWLRNIAINWTDWITLCLISHHKGINCGCGFERLSDVNPDKLGPPDIARIEHYKNLVREKLSLSIQDFDIIYNAYRRRTNSAIDAGKPLLFFKGKWLRSLIQVEFEKHEKIHDANIAGVGDRILSVLISQVGVNDCCNCCLGFHEKMQTLLTDL